MQHRPGHPVPGLILACLLLATACSPGSASSPGSRPVSTATGTGGGASPLGGGAGNSSGSGQAQATTTSDGTHAGSLRGKVIAVDPGHNGGNARHLAQISRLVDIGNGTKACDTTGAETDTGYTEAAFNLDVALRLAALLRAQGAVVVLTRTGDDGVGPCIDQRAAIGNRNRADAALSVHADGAPQAGLGFHVIVPRGIGRNNAIVAPSRQLAVQIRDAFRNGTAEPLSTYLGTTSGAIVARDDLGGLNLSTVPKVFIECANMHNPADARRITSATWRQQAARALAAGLTRYLVSDSPQHP